ncbi:hypothetical protein J7T55_011278 [Diaporthe amygdali]|uniref:uncharacterized protein n=1 Tax=Phomopsis amygdali TaxID=1214568 RepID=UPI0022FF012C|nr:uncharacterized protein J7T55_011278 [Diaporthe amygdali]KAJ0108787.1 hypothetical protein J7T55_011278 [Diaporthe amygdali]
MSSVKSILIVGAGELGTAILAALASHPSKPPHANFSVLLRPDSITSPTPEKQRSNTELKSLGARLVPGNFVDDDTSQLSVIFKDYDVVIQAGGYGLPKGTQLKSATAALQAGVPRYFPWQFGVDYEAIGEGSAQDLFDEMLQVRRLLRSQTRTTWTIISTGLFMSYLFISDFGVVDIENKIIRALGSWENRVTVSTPRDIGRLTAEMVFVPDGTLNEVVYIGGDTISYGKLADILEEVFHGSFSREEWDLRFLKDRLANNPSNLWYKYQCIFGDGKGISWDLTKTLNGQRNIIMTTVEEYIKQNLAMVN